LNEKIKREIFEEFFEGHPKDLTTWEDIGEINGLKGEELAEIIDKAIRLTVIYFFDMINEVEE